MTQAERERNYRVMMHALSEEAQVMKYTSAEIARRSREIYECCYETLQEKQP